MPQMILLPRLNILKYTASTMEAKNAECAFKEHQIKSRQNVNPVL